MGLMVDTNVFIRFEKSGKPIDFSSRHLGRAQRTLQSTGMSQQKELEGNHGGA